jgi:hypothetical protein
MVGWLNRLIERHKERNAALQRERDEWKRDIEGFVARWAAHREEVTALTHAEARLRFFADLEAGAFEVEYAVETAESSLPDLPETLRDLFSRFARVTCRRSGYWIDRSEMSHADLGFLIVGYADEEIILVKPPEDSIYALDGVFCLEEKDLVDSEPFYPTIYHYLLAENFD